VYLPLHRADEDQQFWLILGPEGGKPIRLPSFSATVDI